MTIYVDACAVPKGAYRWCHLFTDGPLDELHAFAAQLGLKREWFQDPSAKPRRGRPRAKWPHYDLIVGKRDRALRMGAVMADREKLLEVSCPQKSPRQNPLGPAQPRAR